MPVKDWLEKADRDLDVAYIIDQYLPQYKDMICFHCQQAAEKYLKSLLTARSIEFPKTHNLSLLLDLLSETISLDDEIYENAEAIESYAVEIRYPQGRFNVNEINSGEAFRSVTVIKNFVYRQLELT